MGKNKNIFVTSDVWFNRPMGEYASMTNEEYNDMIIDNWNSAVSNGDVVYVLGGFGIGDCYDIVLKLNGEIHFLNSIFSHSDSVFRNAIKEGVDNSVNKDMRKRVVFEIFNLTYKFLGVLYIRKLYIRGIYYERVLWIWGLHKRARRIYVLATPIVCYNTNDNNDPICSIFRIKE